MTPAETSFLAEMSRRESLPPLHATRFGAVRVNASPCDPCRYVVTGPAIYLLQMEGARQGRPWFGARYRTQQAAVRALERASRRMERAEKRAQT